MAEPYENIDLGIGFSPQDPSKRIEPGTEGFEGSIPVDFGTGVVPTQPAVNKMTAEQRADKWSMGINKDSRYREFLLAQIETGNEDKEERLAEQSAIMNVRNAKEGAINRILEGARGKGLTQRDLGAIQRINEAPEVGTEDWFAGQYAQKMTNTTTEALLKRQEPTEADFKSMDYIQRSLHLKEGVQKFAENLKAQYDQQGWDLRGNTDLFSRKIDANLERFVPLLFDARMRSEFLALTGNDLSKQYNRYLTMENPSEALKEIKALATQMYAKNPEAALQFLHGFAAFSTSDAALANLFSVVDFATIPGIVTGAKLGFDAWKGVAKSMGNRTFNPIKVLEEAGEVDKASRLIAEQQLKALGDAEEVAKARSTIPGTLQQASYQDLKNHSLTLQQGTQALEQGTYKLARERASRIAEDIKSRTSLLDDTLTGSTVKAQRLEQEGQALTAAGEQTDKIVMKSHPSTVGRVVDVATSNLDDHLTSNYFRIYKFGDRPSDTVTALVGRGEGGTLLESRALQAANNNVGLLNTKQQKRFDRLIGEANLAEAHGNKAAAEKARQVAIRYFEKETGVKIDDALGRAFMEGRSPTVNRVTLTAANDNMRPAGYRPGLSDAQQRIERGIALIKSTWADDTLKPFVTKQNAEHFASREAGFHPNSYEVKEFGGGYVVEYKHPIDETSISAREALRIETKQDNPPGLRQLISAALPLSKDAKLAANMMESAKLAGYSVKNQFELVKKFLDPIMELKRATNAKDWNTFKGFLNEQKNFKKGDEYGRFSRSFGEFEQDFYKYANRIPTDYEHAAYWSYVQLNDIDWVINNLGLYRDKTRQGIMMYGLPTRTELGKEVSMNIEGKVLEKLPSDSKVPFGYAIWDRDPDKIAFFRSDRPGPKGSVKWQESVRQRVADGELKVIHVGPETSQVLKDFYGVKLPKGRVDYVLVDEIHSSPLPFQQLPYKPGGHRVYDYPWVARQADIDIRDNIRANVYYHGDLNHTFFNSQKEANYYAKHFNEARRLLIEAAQSGNESALKAYLGNHLGHSIDRFKGFFEGNGGILKLNEELRITPSGKSIGDTHKLEDIYKRTHPNWSFIKPSDNPHNLYNGGVNLRYAQERGDPLNAFEILGSKRNPVYNFQPAKYVDPFTTAHRAADQLAASRVLDDVRIKAAERFVAEFSDGLAWDITRLRGDPLDALMNAPIKPGISPAEKLAIWDARRSTKELISIRTDFENGVDALQQRMFETLGTSARTLKDRSVVAEWLWGTITSPIVAMRSAAFSLKQGIWNPAALYNQAQAINHIAAVLGPTNALKAATASTQGYFVRTWIDNPAMLQAFAKNLEKGGMWQADHFVEASLAFKNTGYNKAGKEVADWNQYLKSDITQGKVGQVWDWHTAMFRRGEEIGRYNSWYGAYAEWRAANPTARFDSAAITQVLNRADFLNLSMSGVSNSILQKGAQGLLTQFFHAHLRQAEQLWGGRLTPMEKTRVLTWNSIVYGLPVGLGGPLALGLWPVKSEANRQLTEARVTGRVPGWINPDDHEGVNFVMNGLASMAVEQSTGMKFDVGGSGLGGISLLRDFVQNEKGMLDIMTGVGGKTLKGVIQSTYPFYYYAASVGNAPITPADVSDLLENISSYNSAQKVWAAYSYGKYFGRGENRIMDINTTQALFSALTGTQPQEMVNMMDDNMILKAMKEGQVRSRELFNKAIIRFFKESGEGNDKEANIHWDRANRYFIEGNFNPTDKMKMMSQAMQDNQPLVVRAQKRFADQKRTPEAFKEYIDYLRRRGL